MKKILLFTLIASLFCSCVTLLNNPYTEFKVNVPYGTSVIYKDERGVQDTSTPDLHNDIWILAKRSNKVWFPLTIKNDTFEKTIYIKPTISDVYYANIYTNYGIGMLADYNNPNRYSYPRKVYVDLNHVSENGYSTQWPFNRKHDLELFITPPLVNAFAFNLNNLNSDGSPWGIAGGFNYYYNKKSFLSVEAGTARVGREFGRRNYYHTDSTKPPYPSEHKRGWYANVRNHHCFGRFDFGYGVSAGERWGKRYYGRYIFDTANHQQYVNDSVTYQSHVFSVGGSFAVNMRLSRSFYVGLNYQPQLGSFNKGGFNFNYEHMVVVGCTWRIRLNTH